MTAMKAPGCGRMASAGLETGGLFRSTRSVACAVGMRPCSGELAAVYDEVFNANWTLVEPAFKDFTHGRGIARLCAKARARNVGRHSVVGHRTPGVVFRCGLREPYVSRIAGELARFEGLSDGLRIADLSARSVYDVGSALHLRDQLPF